MKPADVRAFVERDWARLTQMKEDYWLDRLDRLGPEEAFHVAEDLRATARASGAAEPDREEDLQAHIRLSALLRSAHAARSR